MVWRTLELDRGHWLKREQAGEGKGVNAQVSGGWQDHFPARDQRSRVGHLRRAESGPQVQEGQAGEGECVVGRRGRVVIPRRTQQGL